MGPSRLSFSLAALTTCRLVLFVSAKASGISNISGVGGVQSSSWPVPAIIVLAKIMSRAPLRPPDEAHRSSVRPRRLLVFSLKTISPCEEQFTPR